MGADCRGLISNIAPEKEGGTEPGAFARAIGLGLGAATPMFSEYLKVDPDLVQLGFSTAVVIAQGVDNTSMTPELISYRRQATEELAASWRGQSISDHPSIAAYHALHEQFGVNSLPASPEKLISFIRRHRDLTGTGAVIDCYNLASARSLLSIGAHDLAKLQIPVTLRVCTDEDRFSPLDGSPSHSCHGEYGYVDRKGRVICRLDVLQGQETAVDPSSTEIVFFLQGNADIPDTELLRGAWYLVELIERFCGGSAQLVALHSAKEESVAPRC